ncbi:hypothetical protein [Chryseobacterium hispalense]|uniref:hypothetical protein n=1 Tax=Chryseobacterium hispalense TaxID=1453492 RepID=UPI00391890F9
MRKEWREYHSDNGEIWEIFADSNDSEKKEDLISESGNDAIMRKYMKTLDYAQVTIIPCARIIDDIKKEKVKKSIFD